MREIIKLFEVGDTTFADDMAAVHEAAREILIKRGALAVTVANIETEVEENIVNISEENDEPKVIDVREENDELKVIDVSKENDETQIDDNDVDDLVNLPSFQYTHEVFLQCLGITAWNELDEDNQNCDGVQGSDVDSEHSNDDDELLFLV